MDEEKQEREEEQAEGAQEGAEVEEHGIRPRFREDEDAEGGAGEGEDGERGEKGKRMSDRRLKDEVQALDGALGRLR